MHPFYRAVSPAQSIPPQAKCLALEMSDEDDTMKLMSVSLRPAESLLDDLDPEQREVAINLRGPVGVLAGAGTGKTRAITYRIAYGVATQVYNPHHLLAVTFTARAAGEMRSRLRDLGVQNAQARTFHAAALRQLSFFWPKVIGGGVPRIVEHKSRLIAETAGRMGLNVDRVLIRDYAAEVEWAKVSMIEPDAYPQRAMQAGRTEISGADFTTIARLISAYEDVKTEKGLIDFEDVLLLMVGMMVEHEEVAEQVRRQYRTFVVDEYQDVSALQQRLLELWLGDRKDLCVVGDVSQTIYSFAGADPTFLTDFGRRYPDAHLIKLERDYRSTPQVVNLANTVLRKAGTHRNKAAVELISQLEDGPEVIYQAFSDDEAEASSVAARIGRLVNQGVSAADIAILYRTNAQSEAYEQALSRAGIGYLVRGGERFFARKEVKDAIVMLRGAGRARADEDAHEAVQAVLDAMGWNPEPPAGSGAARERWDSLNALVQLGEDLSNSRNATFSQYLAELLERAEAQHAPQVDGVTLASLHAAKGLEWEAVFLVGMCEGLMPISMAELPEQIAEERRLLYVGITRAKRHLHLSYGKARTSGGRASRRTTRFLEGLWPNDTQGRHQASRKTRRQETAAQLAGLDVDEELFERLRQWRADLAQHTAKPAFTVFQDLTLAAIATAKPQTLQQLGLLRGVGAVKLERYGPDILKLVRGETVEIGQ